MKKQALRAAFPYTIPVFFGYLFLGMGFDILLCSKGFSVGWALLMSLTMLAGSGQYVAIPMLTSPTSALSAALMTFMVNARHLFYGLSLLDKFRDMGKLKPYMIFSLTDETYSLHCGTKVPESIDPRWFHFFLALLDHSYWLLGTLVGALAGSLLTFDTTGIDFVMTALFVVIFTEQWESSSDHRPALIGLGATLLCLLLCGKETFIMCAMVVIFIALTALRSKVEGGTQA